MLMQHHTEPGIIAHLHVHPRAGKGIAYRIVQRTRIADLSNRLQRCRQIATIVMQHCRTRAQLRHT